MPTHLERGYPRLRDLGSRKTLLLLLAFIGPEIVALVLWLFVVDFCFSVFNGACCHGILSYWS